MNKNCDFSIEEIRLFLNGRKKPYLVTLEQVIEYWDRKNWLTLKGQKVPSVSIAVNVANSYVTEQKRKAGALTIKADTELKNKSNEWYNKRSPYYDQLATPQWRAYREFIFAVRGRKCEVCGKPSNLNIHHTHYTSNRHAWEYLPNEVLVVCGNCHRNIHRIQ